MDITLTLRLITDPDTTLNDMPVDSCINFDVLGLSALPGPVVPIDPDTLGEFLWLFDEIRVQDVTFNGTTERNLEDPLASGEIRSLLSPMPLARNTHGHMSSTRQRAFAKLEAKLGERT